MADEIISDTERTQAQQFQIGLFTTTPNVFVTPLLIAINVAVFVAMVIKGVSIMEPTSEALLHWGANFGPLTTQGQWWRLLTSTFVHIGIIHILMNMYILYSSGMFVERLFGNLGYAVLYLLSGLGGSLVSTAWHPLTVSAGASGAIFGVYGGLFAFLLVQRNAIPSHTLGSLFKNAAIFLGYNLIYGVSQAHVDMSAHLGGFVSGFVLGCALAQPFSATRPSRLARSLVVLIVGLAACAAGAMKLPVSDDLQSALQHLTTIETASLKLYNDSLEQIQTDKLTPPQFNAIVNQKLLPPWNAEKASLQKLRLEGAQKDLVNRITNYMSLRAEGWSMTAQAISSGNAALIQRANQKQAEAENIVKSLNK